MFPDSLRNLIEVFKYLPGIGDKTAERFAFSILDLDDDQVKLFQDSLGEVKSKLHHCLICNVLTDDDICYICSDDFRDKNVLCVVEDVKSVFLFEKMGMYKGKYHVLDSLISPLDGINPEDIGIDKLLDRIHNEGFKELIFDIIVTRLASGVPIGADIEYVDSLTLERALTDRKEII